VLAAAVIGFDQLTKAVVASTLDEGESIRLIDDVLRLSHFRNSGAAFGLLRGFGGVFALAALVGVIAFIGIVVRRPPPRIGVAASLVAAGAFGNLLDRLFRGSPGRGTVVDFVDFRFWPAFNVADAAISIGALLLIAATWRQRPDGSEP
jgi:signal peptidase II